MSIAGQIADKVHADELRRGCSPAEHLPRGRALQQELHPDHTPHCIKCLSERTGVDEDGTLRFQHTPWFKVRTELELKEKGRQ